MRPEVIWRLSRAAYGAGWTRTARVLKALNFLLFHCVLPPEVEVGDHVTLLHHGLGVVLHPQVRFEGRAALSHNVTLGVADDRRVDGPRITIEDEVFIGAGAVVLARAGRCLRIGRRAALGAGAVVVDDLDAGQRVAGPKAVVVGHVNLWTD